MTKSWEDALQHCQELKASLVVIHNEHMLHFVNHIENTLSLGNIHIGLHRTGLNFSWVDGSDMVYSKWLAGQPDNYWGGEGCAIQTSNYAWNDVSCTTHICRFICQQPIEGKEEERPFWMHHDEPGHSYLGRLFSLLTTADSSVMHGGAKRRACVRYFLTRTPVLNLDQTRAQVVAS